MKVKQKLRGKGKKSQIDFLAKSPLLNCSTLCTQSATHTSLLPLSSSCFNMYINNIYSLYMYKRARFLLSVCVCVLVSAFLSTLSLFRSLCSLARSLSLFSLTLARSRLASFNVYIFKFLGTGTTVCVCLFFSSFFSFYLLFLLFKLICFLFVYSIYVMFTTFLILTFHRFTTLSFRLS